MSTHTTTPPHADQAGQAAAEPPPQVSRFDQRGIALQTVIIMVVLLAIAGGVAAVLFSRGQSATQQLESQNIVAAAAEDYKSQTLCNSVTGLTWDGGKCKYEGNNGCTNSGGNVGDTSKDAAAGGKQVAGKCYTEIGVVLGDIK